jgi:hypothetical protein
MRAPKIWIMEHILQTVVAFGTTICFVAWQQHGLHFFKFPFVLGQAGISITWDGVTALCALIALVTGLQTFYVSSIIEKRINKTIVELKDNITATKDALSIATEYKYLSRHEFDLICRKCNSNKRIDWVDKDNDNKKGED